MLVPLLASFLGAGNSAVPIWYGTDGIFDMSNGKAFVFYDPHSPQEALRSNSLSGSEQNGIRRNRFSQMEAKRYETMFPFKMWLEEGRSNGSFDRRWGLIDA